MSKSSIGNTLLLVVFILSLIYELYELKKNKPSFASRKTRIIMSWIMGICILVFIWAIYF